MYIIGQQRVRSSLLPSTGIPAGGIGALTGALIVFCFKAKGRRVVLINWIVTLLLVLAVFAFLIHCPTIELVGVKEPYPDGLVQLLTEVIPYVISIPTVHALFCFGLPQFQQPSWKLKPNLDHLVLTVFALVICCLTIVLGSFYY